MLKKIAFIIASKLSNTSGGNMQDLYAENYNILLREFKKNKINQRFITFIT